ncbi:MAG: DUF1579 domain-containing protein [Planctomycetota bacterium]
MRQRSGLVLVVLGALGASIVFAQAPKEGAKQGSSPAAQKHELPPGMTEADMKACTEASTPGPKHEYLAQSIGVWTGKTTMWMAPTAEPTKSECTSTITAMLDGRFTKCDMTGEMPGMGPFSGFGIYGFDNVAQKFQSTWVDNCGTGMMIGTGELSADGSTMTWTYSYNCPITRKPTVMRQIERRTSKDTMTMEMFGADPHSGKEFKMMEVVFSRKAGSS